MIILILTNILAFCLGVFLGVNFIYTSSFKRLEAEYTSFIIEKKKEEKSIVKYNNNKHDPLL
jgi:hypothetical protein